MESRYYAFGKTDIGRKLLVVFRKRKNKLRVFSARDKTKAKRVSLSNLKPSTEVISLRLPSGLLSDIKLVANKNDIPYQSFMKMMLAEKIKENLRLPGKIDPKYQHGTQARISP